MYKLQIKKIYEGEFLNGQKHGKGYLFYDNNSFYEGNFQNDLFHGRGLFQTKDYKYEGEFKFGNFDGLGIKTEFNRGQAFEGEWEKGKRNGNVNFYQMKLESASVWKEDKKVEVSEIILSTETSGSGINLNYNNINKTSNEFREMLKKIQSGNLTEFTLASPTQKITEYSSTTVTQKNLGSENIDKPNIPKESLTTNVRVKEDSKNMEKISEEEQKKIMESSSRVITQEDKEKTGAKDTQQGSPEQQGQDKNCNIF